MADRSVVYRLRADISQFRSQLAAASASVKDAGDKMTATNKEGAKFRAGLDTVGTTARNVGLVAAAGLGAAVLKAANFDQAMSNVRAATGETAANMDLLREAALKAGADTAFSATEAADGIEQLSKAGVSTKDVLAGGLRGALDLAAAGNQTVGEAAETAATAMTQFGLAGADIPHIADLLAAGAGKAQGEVSDLAAALNQGGLVASQMGLSIEDTTGTLAAFASAGLVGSDAGTSFKSMLQRLQNPLGEGARAMEELGINAYDAEGNFVGITSVAGQLQEKLGPLTQAQRDAALAQIFGSDAVRAATVLYKQGASGIQGWIDKTNDTGFAAETAATKLDNLKGDLEELGGALETALIGTGSGSQGPLRGLVQSLTDVVNAYNKLPGAAQSAVGGVLGVTAAIGGGAFVFSKVIQGVANTREAMQNLGISLDGVRTKADGTGRSLGAMAGKAAGVAGLAVAIGQVTDGLGRIDAGNLDRGLEALTRGKATKDINQLVDDFKILGSTINNITEPGFELFSGFGVFYDTGLDKAANNIEQVDQALASLVDGGSADKANAQFSALSSALQAQGISVDDIVKRFPEYKTALDNAGASGNFATSAFGSIAGAVSSSTAAVQENTTALGFNAEEQEAILKAATETASSFLGLGESVNDSKVSLADYTKQLADQAAALEQFTVNAEKALSRGVAEGFVEQLRQAGPEGALRLKELANATDEEIAAINAAFGRGEDATQAYQDSLLGISAAIRALPEDVVTEIRATGLPQTRADIVDLTAKYNLTPKDVRTLIRETGGKPTREMVQSIIREAQALNRQPVNPRVNVLGVGNALSALANLGNTIANLNGRTATVTTIYRGVRVGSTGTSVDRADGGQVWASGGQSRGARDDSIDARLSHREFVQPVASVDYYGERFMEAVRTRRFPRQAFADGGLVGGRQRFADGGLARRTRRRRAAKRPANPALGRFRKELERATTALEDERNVRDSLVGTVRDQFRSDVFASSNVWSAAAGDPRAMLRGDIAKAQAFQQSLKVLASQGLKGGALAAVAETGDIRNAQSLAGLGVAGVREYQSLFNERERVSQAVGSYAGNAAYGAGITSMAREVSQLNATVKRLEAQAKARAKNDSKRAKATGRAVANGVNRGAAKGKKARR